MSYLKERQYETLSTKREPVQRYVNDYRERGYENVRGMLVSPLLTDRAKERDIKMNVVTFYS